MGGMFTTVKIREGLAANDYADPPPYRNPAGTVAYEVASAAAPPASKPAASPSAAKPAIEMKVIKPPVNHKGH
jgi:hypothetical protein